MADIPELTFTFTGPEIVKTPGITGELVWSDSLKSDVAYYPPECLPAVYTTYNSAFAWQPATQPYLNVPLALTPFGAGLMIGLFPYGLTTADIKRWTTTHRHIFAQCQYRVNYPLIVTQAMIDAGIITLPEHIFEILSVTKEPTLLPPIIKPVPQYTVSIANMRPESVFTVQLTLIWETAVTWTVSYTFTKEIPSGSVSFDSAKKQIIIKPAVLGEGTLTTRVVATNYLGDFSKNVVVVIVKEARPNVVEEKLSDETVPTKERLEDILWRQLSASKQLIPKNIYDSQYFDRAAMNYRMDNGSSKAFDILKQPAFVTYVPSHTDASNRTIEITSFEGIKANSVLYVNYVAAIEHYIRQVVTITWMALDMGYLGFVSFPTAIGGANYRFYKWSVNSKASPGGKRNLEAWRIVESFNYQPEVASFLPSASLDSAKLVDFIYGSRGAGTYQIPYLDPSTDYDDIIKAIGNEGLLPKYSLTMPFYNDNNGYRELPFPPNDVPAPEWYDAYVASGDPESYLRTVSHVVYNVHPDYLKWRDVDKFAYPISLAETLQDAIGKGQETFVPSNPNPEFSTYLSAENFKIEPIDSVPRIIGLANAKAVSSPLGLFPRVSTGYVYGQFASNIIREPFKRGTKILVESNPVGERGSVVLTLDCKGGGIGFVNCVRDENYKEMMVFSNNSDGFIIGLKIRYGSLDQDLPQLLFDPLSGGINYTDLNVNSVDLSKIDSVVGLAGLTGDSPGTQPGRVVSFYKNATQDAFKEYYIGEPQTEIPSKRLIGFSLNGNKLILQLGEFVYTGHFSVKVVIKVKIKANATGGMRENISKSLSDIKDTGNEVTVLFGSGNSIESVIDRIGVSLASVDSLDSKSGISGNVSTIDVTAQLSQLVEADYYWLKGESIIFDLPWLSKIKDTISKDVPGIWSIEAVPEITSATITGILDDYASDFLSKGTDFEQYEEGFKLWKGADFIRADFATSHIDGYGNIFVVFEDQNGNLSCSVSSDGGITWTLQYALSPKMEYKNQDAALKYPFSVRSNVKEELFLFYIRNRVLYVNIIPLAEINYEDAFIIKDYPKITDETTSTDNFFSRVRMSVSWAAGGNLDEENIKFIAASGKYKIGNETVFTNVEFTTPYFSAYQGRDGEIRVMFADSSGKLQCHYSGDNGMSWNDLWVCMKYGVDGILEDVDKMGQTASAYRLGFNPHSDSSESIIESPYAFLRKQGKVHLFYVYKSCLLCKEFSDPASCQSDAWTANNYDALVKYVQSTASVFVDGNASRIRDEIDSKKITMKHAYAIAEFGEDREIVAQRMHATELSDGSIKLFYKNSSNRTRSATMNTKTWEIDDMMHKTEETAT